MADATHFRVFDANGHVFHEGKVDPKTGLGLTYTIQASVIAEDGATADALATALCIMEESEAKAKLVQLPKVAARVLRQNADGRLHCWQTDNWQTYVK